jgi:hypothetical protein
VLEGDRGEEGATVELPVAVPLLDGAAVPDGVADGDAPGEMDGVAVAEAEVDGVGVPLREGTAVHTTVNCCVPAADGAGDIDGSVQPGGEAKETCVTTRFSP